MDLQCKNVDLTREKKVVEIERGIIESIVCHKKYLANDNFITY